MREAETNGVPSSHNCLDAFAKGWARPFGWPKMVAGDRGMHNRGVFSNTLSKKGVRFNGAALESPEQIGRVERRNQTLKYMLNKVIKETNAIGRHQVDMALTECITALNEMTRHGGFAPVQWVLAKFPRSPATFGDEEERQDIGAIQAHYDGPTEFALQGKYRLEAREAFVKWDCGARTQRAYLRNAAPIPGPYKTGDIVSYCRRARAGETGIQWSVGSRIVGFETDSNYPDTPPSNAWVICDGLSVLVALDKIRPCTAAELLAYQFMQGKDLPRNPFSETQEQQSFIDEREPPRERQRGAKEDLPEPRGPPVELRSQGDSSGSAEILSAKELRAGSPEPTRQLTIAPPSPAKRGVSPEPDTSLHSQWKRNKVTGKGVEMLERIGYYFDEDLQYDQDREAFIQVRLAAPKAKKTPARKPPKKKDGDKNLSFASCSPEIQKGLLNSRYEEWKKFESFNAGVILSREEVQQLQTRV